MRKAAVALVVIALVVEITALVLVGLDDDDDDSPASGPSRTEDVAGTAPPPAQSGGPITDACSLVNVGAVAKAVGLPEGGVAPQPREQDPASGGASCDFVEQSEDKLRVFTVTVQEAGDAGFASATIGARTGKRISGLGDVAVLEQSETRSRISVARGTRYVQLQSQRKPASEDAMVGLARQAVAKL